MMIADRWFILLFFPISLVLYWLVFRGSRLKLWVLCAVSFAFYALGSLTFVPLLLGLSLLTFWLARRKRGLIGVGVNLLALILFKYWDFGAQNLNQLAGSSLVPLLNLALPLGISFYIFKHIGYLLDTRSGKTPATDDALLFVTFSAFFAQIGAGPISSFGDTGAQMRSLPRTLSGDAAYQGFIHVSFGLAKKVLIADVLGQALQATLFAAQLPKGGFIDSWLMVIAFAMQLYFDFSAYTDIALGVGYLFGISLPPNFNNPYLARSPSEFWQRWHISLSSWFRNYVFTPASRSLLRRTGCSEASQYAANLITMFLVGLWHGPQSGYILWGIYHGLLLNINAWARRRHLGFNTPLLATFATLVAVLIGWVFFFSPTIDFAGAILAGMAGLRGLGTPGAALVSFGAYNTIILLLALLIASTGITEAANVPRLRQPVLFFAFGMLVALSLLTSGTLAPFVYVQY